MKSLSWRYSAVVGILVLFSVLSTTQGHAYPAPEFQSVSFFSMHQESTLIGTVAAARISGPSPDDVVSFDVSGNGVNIPILPWKSSKESGLYYLAVDPSIVPDGNYVFTVKDSQGRSVSTSKNFSFNGTVPQVDSTTMVPANNAYVGTTTPTLSFSAVAGDYLYSIHIRDMSDTAIWYSVDPGASTSYTIPAGILQPDTAYMWWARVWDTTKQNLRQTSTFYFYTGTKTAPELNLYNLLSFPSGADDLGFFPYGRAVNIAPWDIKYFRCTGPDMAVYNLATLRFQFSFPAYISGWKVFDPPTSIPPNGTYTFDIENLQGQTASATKEYTYDPIPDFIADTRLPANNAYLEKTQNTFSWSRVQGDLGDGSYLYSIRITDYSTNMRWIDSPSSSDTTYTTSGTGDLPVGSSYKWRVNVIDTRSNNYRNSDYRTFTVNLPPAYVNKDDETCGGKIPCYTSIQAAINATVTGTAIEISGGAYAEAITLNESKSLTLKGGWDASFSSQTPNITVIKAPKVTQGALTLQMLTIKP